MTEITEFPMSHVSWVGFAILFVLTFVMGFVLLLWRSK
jgi:hypothetical protein